MSDLDKIKGNLGPAPREPERRQSEVDKDKFKDLMSKVEESDESEKKDQRRTKGQRKEDEDEDVDAEQTPAAPTGDFSLFMNPEEDKDSVFDVKSGSSLSIKEPDEPPENGSFLFQTQRYEDSPPEDESAGLPQSFYSSGSSQAIPPSSEEPQTTPPEIPQSQNTDQNTIQDNQPLRSDQPEQKATQPDQKKKKQADESLLKQTPDRYKMTKTKAFKVEKERGKKMPVTAPELEKSPKAEGKPRKQMPGKQDTPSTSQTAKQASEQQAPMGPKMEHETKKPESQEPRKVEVQEHMASMTTTHQGKGRDGEKKEGDDEHKKMNAAEATEEALEAGLQAQVTRAPFPQLTPEKLPKYATLNEHIFEIFEKLSGIMIVTSFKEGDRSTHVTLDMDHSPFKGAEIEIKEFNTAPGVFNVQLTGDPHAVELFNANIDDLMAAFQQANYSFKVNIQRPILKTNETYARVERKEESDGAGGQTGGQK